MNIIYMNNNINMIFVVFFNFEFLWCVYSLVLVHYVAAVLNMLDSSMITLIYTKGTVEINVSETLISIILRFSFFLVFYDNGHLRG